jgi:hypothetical protein
VEPSPRGLGRRNAGIWERVCSHSAFVWKGPYWRPFESLKYHAPLREQLASATPVSTSTRTIFTQLSIAERGKRRISTERGEMTVAQVIESFIVDHAEEHLAQVETALRG